MFGEGHHDSIIQRGIDEALACQDMLERAPIRPSLLARVRARLATAGRAWARPRPTPRSSVTRAVSLKLTR
jgi:hypothetical protein